MATNNGTTLSSLILSKIQDNYHLNLFRMPEEEEIKEVLNELHSFKPQVKMGYMPSFIKKIGKK